MKISREELAQELEGARPWVSGEQMLRYIESEGWLRSPDQEPGRTITESELEEAKRFAQHHGIRPMLHRHFGLTVIPDAKQTNAGRWEKFIRESNPGLSESDVEDMAAHMDQFGVKAPGGDDE